MRLRRLGLALVIVVGSAGCGPAEDTIMPDVLGQRLDIALSDIKRAGFSEEVEVLGGGAFGVIDESNWEVCDQEPAAAQVVTIAPRLTVDRSCGGGASEPTTLQPEATGDPSKQPSEPPTPGLEGTESGAEVVLTVENSEDLAALLAGPNAGDSVEAFTEEYGGGAATIAFDAHITYLLKSDRVTYSSARIVAGDYGASLTTWPTFEITHASLPETSNLQQDDLNEGQNIRITALVGYYEGKEGYTYDTVPVVHLLPLVIEGR